MWESVIFFIISAIGFIIFLLNKGRKINLIGFAIFLIAFFGYLQTQIEETEALYTAWATVVLAFFAAMTLYENNRLRKDSNEKEQRDRKEKLLKEMSDWANNLQTVISDFNESQVNRVVFLLPIIYNLKRKILNLKAEQYGLIKIAEIIDKELALSIRLIDEPTDKNINLLDGIVGELATLVININKYIFNDYAGITIRKLIKPEYTNIDATLCIVYIDKLDIDTRKLIEQIALKRAESINPSNINR